MNFRCFNFCLSLARVLPGLLLFVIVSCGGGGTTKTSIEVSTMLLAGSDVDAMLYGKNFNSGASFGVSISSGSKDLVLPNGSWNFHVISWDRSGSGFFEGLPRCGKVRMDLKGGDIPIPITISQTGCVNDDFTRYEYFSSTQFRNVKFDSCTNLEKATSSGYNCQVSPNNDEGSVKYVKVSLISYMFTGDNIDFTQKAFESACVPVDSATSLKIPVSSIIAIPLKIESFSNAACTTRLTQSYTFLRGLNSQPGQVRIFADPDGTTTKVFLSDTAPAFITHDLNPLYVYEDQLYSSPIDHSGGAIDSCEVITGWDTTLLQSVTCIYNPITKKAILSFQGLPDKSSTTTTQIKYKVKNVGVSATIGVATFTLEENNDTFHHVGFVLQTTTVNKSGGIWKLSFEVSDMNDESNATFDCDNRMYAKHSYSTLITPQESLMFYNDGTTIGGHVQCSVNISPLGPFSTGPIYNFRVFFRDLDGLGVEKMVHNSSTTLQLN